MPKTSLKSAILSFTLAFFRDSLHENIYHKIFRRVLLGPRLRIFHDIFGSEKHGAVHMSFSLG